MLQLREMLLQCDLSAAGTGVLWEGSRWWSRASSQRRQWSRLPAQHNPLMATITHWHHDGSVDAWTGEGGSHSKFFGSGMFLPERWCQGNMALHSSWVGFTPHNSLLPPKNGLSGCWWREAGFYRGGSKPPDPSPSPLSQPCWRT